MQEWRQWETADEVNWGLAVKRELVLRPLADEEVLRKQDVEEAMVLLGLSRTTVYKQGIGEQPG